MIIYYLGLVKLYCKDSNIGYLNSGRYRVQTWAMVTMANSPDHAVSDSGNCVLRVTQWQLDSAAEHMPDALYCNRASRWLGTWVAMLHSKRFFLMDTMSVCHQTQLTFTETWKLLYKFPERKNRANHIRSCRPVFTLINNSFKGILLSNKGIWSSLTSDVHNQATHAAVHMLTRHE